MTHDQLLTEARKRPDCIWIPPSSVRTIAMWLRSLDRSNPSLSAIENGISSGTMQIYGVPVRVYEIV